MTGRMEIEAQIAALLAFDRAATSEPEARRRFREGATLGVKHYGPQILRYLARRTCDAQRAEEAYGVFEEKLWINIEGFRGKTRDGQRCGFRAWVYALARSALTQVGRDLARARRNIPVSNWDSVASGARAEVAELYATRGRLLERRSRTPWTRKTELRDIAYAMLDALDGGERELVYFRIDCDMDWKEIALILDGPFDTEAAHKTASGRARKSFSRLAAKLRESAKDRGQDAAARRELASCGGTPNPYRAGEPFREEDTAVFPAPIGLVDRLVDAVAKQRLVTLIGPPSSGKTSLLRAGLWPRLRGDGDWTVVSARAGHSPSRSLERAICAELEPLRGPETTPFDIVRAHIEGTGRRLLLCIDSTEGTPEAVLNDWVERFLTGSEGVVVLLVRSGSQEFAATMAQGPDSVSMFMPSPTRSELLGALVTPASRLGVRYEEGLAEQLAHDLLNTHAPRAQLQRVGSRLWCRRDREQRLITREGLRELVGALRARTSQASSSGARGHDGRR